MRRESELLRKRRLEVIELTARQVRVLETEARFGLAASCHAVIAALLAGEIFQARQIARSILPEGDGRFEGLDAGGRYDFEPELGFLSSLLDGLMMTVEAEAVSSGA